MSSQGDHRKEGRDRRADAGETRPRQSVSTRQRRIANAARNVPGHRELGMTRGTHKPRLGVLP